MMNLPSFHKKGRKIEYWNRHYPIGTNVTVRLDSGKNVETETTSAAQLLGGHTPVVWCKGISGCYCLDRVTPKEKK